MEDIILLGWWITSRVQPNKARISMCIDRLMSHGRFQVHHVLSDWFIMGGSSIEKYLGVKFYPAGRFWQRWRTCKHALICKSFTVVNLHTVRLYFVIIAESLGLCLIVVRILTQVLALCNETQQGMVIMVYSEIRTCLELCFQAITS